MLRIILRGQKMLQHNMYCTINKKINNIIEDDQLCYILWLLSRFLWRPFSMCDGWVVVSEKVSSYSLLIFYEKRYVDSSTNETTTNTTRKRCEAHISPQTQQYHPFSFVHIFYNSQDAKATRKYCPASSSIASNTETVHLKERASSQRIGAISKMFEYQTHEEYWTKPLDGKVKSVRL